MNKSLSLLILAVVIPSTGFAAPLGSENTPISIRIHRAPSDEAHEAALAAFNRGSLNARRIQQPTGNPTVHDIAQVLEQAGVLHSQRGHSSAATETLTTLHDKHIHKAEEREHVAKENIAAAQEHRDTAAQIKAHAQREKARQQAFNQSRREKAQRQRDLQSAVHAQKKQHGKFDQLIESADEVVDTDVRSADAGIRKSLQSVGNTIEQGAHDLEGDLDEEWVKL